MKAALTIQRFAGQCYPRTCCRWRVLQYLLAITVSLYSIKSVHAETEAFWDGWYLSGGFGWDYSQSVELDSSDASIDFDRGVFQFTGALGKQWSNGFRTEIEYSVHENAPEILFGRSPELELDPDREDLITAKSFMLNAVRDFRVGQSFRPYLGIGAGLSKVDLVFSDMPVDGLFIQRPRREVINDSDTAFALQAFAGFTVPVTRHFDLAADYRYLHVPNVGVEEVNGAALEFDHGVQSVWLHARYYPTRGSNYNNTTPDLHSRASSATSGLFIIGQLGGGFAEDLGRENLPTIDAFDPGLVAVAGIGHDWRRFRAELEGGFRNNRVEVVELGPDIGEDAASGDMRTSTLIASIAYRMRPNASIRPFVGLGAGVLSAKFDVDGFGFCSNFVCREERREQFVKGTETAGVVQIKAGVDVALSSTLHFTADYRYLVSTDIDLARPDGSRFKGNIKHTAVVAGLRYFPR